MRLKEVINLFLLSRGVLYNADGQVLATNHESDDYKRVLKWFKLRDQFEGWNVKRIEAGNKDMLCVTLEYAA